jgi:hypothetical protein
MTAKKYEATREYLPSPPEYSEPNGRGAILPAIIQSAPPLFGGLTGQVIDYRSYRFREGGSFQDWVDDGTEITKVVVWSQLLLGDWYNEGVHYFGRQAAQTIRATISEHSGYAETTIEFFATTATRWPHEARASLPKGTNLTHITTTREVAAVDPEIAIGLIDDAIKHGWKKPRLIEQVTATKQSLIEQGRLVPYRQPAGKLYIQKKGLHNLCPSCGVDIQCGDCNHPIPGVYEEGQE